MVQYQERMRLENRIFFTVFPGLSERFNGLGFLALTYEHGADLCEDPDRDILIIGPDSKPGYHGSDLCEDPDRDILIIGPDSKSGYHGS